MKKILEYTPTDEDILVSRLLVKIHQNIDLEFPDASPASRRFAKTLFSVETGASEEETKANDSKEKSSYQDFEENEIFDQPAEEIEIKPAIPHSSLEEDFGEQSHPRISSQPMGSSFSSYETEETKIDVKNKKRFNFLFIIVVLLISIALLLQYLDIPSL